MACDGWPGIWRQTDNASKTDNPIKDKRQQPLSQVGQKDLQNQGSQQVGPKIFPQILPRFSQETSKR